MYPAMSFCLKTAKALCLRLIYTPDIPERHLSCFCDRVSLMLEKPETGFQTAGKGKLIPVIVFIVNIGTPLGDGRIGRTFDLDQRTVCSAFVKEDSITVLLADMGG